ncbi:hypothetical protein D3C87_2156480 [compost metagenome]
MFFGKDHTTLRCAGHEGAALTAHQTAGVGNVKTVYILMSRNACNDLRCVDMGRQRKLNQDPVNGWIVVKTFDHLH